MIWSIFPALGISAAVIFLLWLLRGFLLMPVSPGENEQLYIILRVSGPSPALENTVDSLLWLMDDGVLSGELALEDDGMDEETRQTARLLARRHEKVTLWTKKKSSGS